MAKRAIVTVTIAVAIIVVPLLGELWAAERAQEAQEAQDAPIVKLVSPARTGYVMLPAGRDKLPMCLEIIDASGAGIETTSSGLPKFMEPNENVALFLDYVTARGTYTNNKGQSVTQLVALVPVQKMHTGEGKFSPPIDLRSLGSIEGEREIHFQPSDMVDVALFNFRVRDLRGAMSRAEEGAGRIAFATELYKPAAAVKPEQ